MGQKKNSEIDLVDLVKKTSLFEWKLSYMRVADSTYVYKLVVVQLAGHIAPPLMEFK